MTLCLPLVSAYVLYTEHYFFGKKIKVKTSRYRPGVTQRVPGGLASQIFTTFGT
jgi:hypothetical protein